MNFTDLKEALLDILYPREAACIGCCRERLDIDSLGLCPACKLSLPFISPPACTKCGKPLYHQMHFCPDCRTVRHSFSQAVSVFEYTGLIKQIIHRFKYEAERYLADPMAYWMSKSLERQNTWQIDSIIPVPLHPRRQQKRGYNQSALLAQGIGRRIKKEVLQNVLIRSRDTPPQYSLGRQQRMINLMDAFEVTLARKIQGKNIVLVDDIYTTGSTADQCSRTLVKAGAQKVYVLTLAAGRNTPS